MSKELVSGVAGGLVGGLVVSGLMKVPAIRPSKEVVEKKLLNAGESVTLKPQTTYKFAIVLLHGDGDLEVKHTVTVNGVTTELMGDEQAIELLANQTLEITATNTSTVESKSTMTIEILSQAW